MSSSIKRKSSANHTSIKGTNGSSYSQSGPSNTTAKRTRFDDQSNNIDEDTIGDLDIEEQDRKRLQQGRKGRVITDGYDSEDSSDEEDGEEEAGGTGSTKPVLDEEEDEDMFNPKEEEDDNMINANGKGLKGEEKTKFLGLNDIEGQEFSDDDDVKDEEKEDAELELEDDEEQDEDEDLKDDPFQRSKKKGNRKDGNEKGGIKIDSFNMKNELATGKFDEEGNYIANAKDPHAEHDKWLAGNYSRKNIAAAKEAQERRIKEREQKEKLRENSQLDEDECKMGLVDLLMRRESVLNALQRLGGEQKRLKKSNKSSGQSSQSDQDEELTKIKADLNKVTSLASELMSRYGLVNIYDSTYESLLGDVRKSGLVRSTWDPAAEKEKKVNSSFVYKWSPAYLQAMEQSNQSDQQIFGPFDVQDLISWKQDGYFGDSGERILLKPNDNDEVNWSSWKDIFG